MRRSIRREARHEGGLQRRARPRARRSGAYLAASPFARSTPWPNLPGFRETTLAYFSACAALGARLHRAFACDLGLRPDFFADKFDRPMATLRLLHYPPRRQAAAAASPARASIPITATSPCSRPTMSAASRCATRAGQWIDAPVIPGAFIVNIGDCLMRWTNDVYVSTPHRVVNRSGRERYSIAFFYDPNPDAMVETIPELRAEKRVHPLSADPGRRLSEDASGREQAEGGRSVRRLGSRSGLKVMSKSGRPWAGGAGPPSAAHGVIETERKLASFPQSPPPAAAPCQERGRRPSRPP